jgi:replicative DNA helicase
MSTSSSEKTAGQQPAEDTAKETEELETSPHHFTALAEDLLNDIEALGSRHRHETRNSLRGVQTGFTDFDHLTGGLTAGTLTVVAGRPAMGRTTLISEFVRHAAVLSNTPAGLVTLQEKLAWIGTRMKAAQSRVMRHHIHSGTMTEDEWQRMARALPKLAAAPLYVRQMTGTAFLPMLLELEEWVGTDKLELLAIDGIEDLVAASDGALDMAGVAHKLKTMAVELNIPIVVTTQVHRSAAARPGRIPHMDDVDESLVFTADTVVVVHRPDAYEKNEARAGEADLIVWKQRSGPTATVTVAFQGHYGRFVDMAQS